MSKRKSAKHSLADDAAGILDAAPATESDVLPSDSSATHSPKRSSTPPPPPPTPADEHPSSPTASAPDAAKLVFVMQTPEETREFIASLYAPVTEAESESTVARAEEWTLARYKTTPNFGSRLRWKCKATKKANGTPYIAFTTHVVGDDGELRETAISDIITPIFNFMAMSSFLQFEGDLNSPEFPAKWDKITRSMPMAMSDRTVLGPETVRSEAEFQAAIETFQFDELCPMANSMSKTPKPIADVIREVKNAGKGQVQPAVKHVPDKGYHLIRVKSLTTQPMKVADWSDASIAAAVRVCEEQWGVLEADDAARTFYGKGGFAASSSALYSFAKSFRKDIGEEHSASDKPLWYPKSLTIAPVRVMMPGNRPRILSHESLEALEKGKFLNNFVGFGSLRPINWHSNVPCNVPFYWMSITLFGRVVNTFGAQAVDSSDNAALF